MASHDDNMAAILRRLSADDGGDSGGGGGVTSASGGNIFSVGEDVGAGLSESWVEGLSGVLDWQNIMAYDIKKLLEDSTPGLNSIFGRMNIGGHNSVLLVDYFSSMKGKTRNFLGQKNPVFFSRGGGD